MVDEFSAFARMPEASFAPGDIAETVRQAVFLESVRLPEISISVDLPETPIDADFDSRLISQTLTNLIKNAVEAMEGAGLETIKDPRIVVSAEVVGDKVRIAVADNGKGWPKENRQRLLEPYITTREKGTGLGLAIVARIIEQHGGTVDLIDAEPDDGGRIGACFTFTLPLKPADTNEDAPVADASQHKPDNKAEPAAVGTNEEGPPIAAVERT
jgi:two-component system, NtrC family, nitrogen regulation sensor histidine kinase NtrY